MCHSMVYVFKGVGTVETTGEPHDWGSVKAIMASAGKRGPRLCSIGRPLSSLTTSLCRGMMKKMKGTFVEQSWPHFSSFYLIQQYWGFQTQLSLSCLYEGVTLNFFMYIVGIIPNVILIFLWQLSLCSKFISKYCSGNSSPLMYSFRKCSFPSKNKRY